jgi:hypothetical protein
MQRFESIHGSTGCHFQIGHHFVIVCLLLKLLVRPFGKANMNSVITYYHYCHQTRLDRRGCTARYAGHSLHTSSSFRCYYCCNLETILDKCAVVRAVTVHVRVETILPRSGRDVARTRIHILTAHVCILFQYYHYVNNVILIMIIILCRRLVVRRRGQDASRNHRQFTPRIHQQ